MTSPNYNLIFNNNTFKTRVKNTVNSLSIENNFNFYNLMNINNCYIKKL